MRRGIRFLVHVNLVILGQGHAEFLFDRFPGCREKTFAKVTVFAGSRGEVVRRVNGILHM